MARRTTSTAPRQRAAPAKATAVKATAVEAVLVRDAPVEGVTDGAVPPVTGPAPRRLLGAHTPSGGSLTRSVLSYVDKIGADVAQIYVSNPRGWALPAGNAADDEAFRIARADRDLTLYIHAALLVNLGSPTPATVDRSVATLRHALTRGAAVGASGVVFHAGSAVDPARHAVARRQVRERLLPLLDEAAGTGWPPLLVESSAGGGQCLASRVEHLGDYLDLVDRHPGLGVCFDTCHAWAAGHDLAQPGGMTRTLDALVDACGPDRLMVVHANDSRDPLGSSRDRHENLGAGTIGAAPFAELLAHPATAGVPIVVETPSEPPHAGHVADLALLRSLGTAAAHQPHAARRPAAPPVP